ncbi:hypothetical protein [Heyndrickxia sporothermodurans]|uniref:hypothetical protein n=1 Tax=Heyndrickxia sporothermodurans TaxID=46224 RepID=UPI0035E17076
MPHWIHLTYSQEEIREMLSKRYRIKDVENILQAIFKSDWLNRLHFEDYIDIFKESGLRIAKIETTEEIDYPFIYPNYGIEEVTIQEKLNKFHEENNRNYKCRDMLVVLVK